MTAAVMASGSTMGVAPSAHAGGDDPPGGPEFRNTVSFDFTGTPETYEVPSHIICAALDVYGAQGGSSSLGSTYIGGMGGHGRVTVALRPGESLVVYVGGAGNEEDGGFNGGGEGEGGPDPARGGGGASDIRRGGSTPAERFLVAGGGGGVSGHAPPFGPAPQPGGAGGGPTGADGAGSGNGKGATVSAPGAGGGGGASGSGPTGGEGRDAGGGGGGGAFGGGGGGNFSGGGGGSGLGPAGTTWETGVRAGPGAVTITYVDNDRSCIKGAPPTTEDGDPLVRSPDPAITPGAVDASVEEADVRRESCDGSPAKGEKLDGDAKDATFRAYGLRERHEEPHTIDRLVPPELGGTNDVANLWPQPDAQAERKDKAEARALEAVCDGSMTLAEAQQQLQTDWREVPE